MKLFDELVRCRPWIEAALDHSRTHDFGDVVLSCVSGEMQLWPAEKGCLVTQITEFPRRKILQIFVAGGEMQAVLDLSETAMEWARAQGCDAAMMMGRTGWHRVLGNRGFETRLVVMERKLG